MVRNREIERLVKYAQSLGVKVIFSNKKCPDTSAEWTLDGSEIYIYTKKQYSKTDTILSLIHEIAHMLNHIHRNDRQRDEKFEEAIDASDADGAAKRHRLKILRVEKQGTQYWETIYKETNLQFPLWKLYAAMELDVWPYEIYVETGGFPTVKERKKKRKELKIKHKDIDYE